MWKNRQTHKLSYSHGWVDGNRGGLRERKKRHVRKNAAAHWDSFFIKINQLWVKISRCGLKDLLYVFIWRDMFSDGDWWEETNTKHVFSCILLCKMIRPKDLDLVKTRNHSQVWPSEVWKCGVSLELGWPHSSPRVNLRKWIFFFSKCVWFTNPLLNIITVKWIWK